MWTTNPAVVSPECTVMIRGDDPSLGTSFTDESDLCEIQKPLPFRAGQRRTTSAALLNSSNQATVGVAAIFTAVTKTAAKALQVDTCRLLDRRESLNASAG